MEPDRDTLEEALDRVRALHHRRRHTLGDFVAYGQTEFPDLCDHCRSIYPCATVRALDAPACADCGDVRACGLGVAPVPK